MPQVPETVTTGVNETKVDDRPTTESPVETNVVKTKPAPTRSSKTAKAVKKGKKTMKTATKPSKNGKAKKHVIKCICGCGSPTGNRFAPGHDAQLKSKLLKAHRSDKGMSDKQKSLVKELGWSKLITK